MGLAAVGCIGAEPETGQRVWLGAFPVLFLGVAVFLLFIGLQAFVSSRRRSRRLAKVLLALVAGSACGALWMLLVDTVVNAAIRDAVNETAVRVVGVATALLVAAVLLTPNRLSTVVGRSAMVVGFHCLALPIAACLAVVVRGARLGTGLAGICSQSASAACSWASGWSSSGIERSDAARGAGTARDSI
jgi:hypothetical protein